MTTYFLAINKELKNKAAVLKVWCPPDGVRMWSEFYINQLPGDFREYMPDSYWVDAGSRPFVKDEDWSLVSSEDGVAGLIRMVTALPDDVRIGGFTKEKTAEMLFMWLRDRSSCGL
jgi:hypothetical protein